MKAQEAESQIVEEDSANSEQRRKRGRPRKTQPAAGIDPEVLHRAVLEVKKMARDYARGNLQSYIRYIRTTRPRLLKNAGIPDNDREDESVRYNAQSVAAMTEGDRKVIYRYLCAREEITFLEKAVIKIPEARIRKVACDTLLKGIRVVDLLEKYDLSERTIRWRKHKALEYLAALYLAASFQYRITE